MVYMHLFLSKDRYVQFKFEIFLYYFIIYKFYNWVAQKYYLKFSYGKQSLSLLFLKSADDFSCIINHKGKKYLRQLQDVKPILYLSEVGMSLLRILMYIRKTL